MTTAKTLLKSYSVDVEDPNVSGIEHHHMLCVRDRLMELKGELSEEELEVLKAADLRLVAQASAFVAELARFVDLDDKRRKEGIPPSRWWWYLDVLAEVPLPNAPLAA